MMKRPWEPMVHSIMFHLKCCLHLSSNHLEKSRREMFIRLLLHRPQFHNFTWILADWFDCVTSAETNCLNYDQIYWIGLRYYCNSLNKPAEGYCFWKLLTTCWYTKKIYVEWLWQFCIVTVSMKITPLKLFDRTTLSCYRFSPEGFR